MENVSVNALSNELPLYIHRSKKAPVVTLQVWVRTGSADELKNEAGISHFIEHLVFKGTPSFKAGEIAQKVEAVGGELNAYTSFDQTVFYVTVPKEHLNVAAHVLSEMVSAPLFDPKEVDNEREVVIEEIKMGLDQPSRVASKMLFSQMFEGHPYEAPVIGTKENVERVTVDEIKDYFTERYVVENMSLICVGDLDSDDEVKQLLEMYFSKQKKKPEKKRERKRGKRSLEGVSNFKFIESEFERDYFYLSWAVEGFKSKESEVYELLALLLGQGESSYLYKRLKLEKKVCRSIGSSYFGSEDFGIFVISGTCMGTEFQQLQEALPEVIEEFLKQEDISEDLVKASNIFLSEQSYASESLASQSRSIGDDWLYYGKLGENENRRKRVSLLKEADLKAASLRVFLKEPRLSVLSKNEPSDIKKFLLKTKELGKITPNFKNLSVDRGEIKNSTSPATKENKDFVWETQNKNKVVFVKSTESEVVSFKIGIQGGEVYSSDSSQGLVALFNSVWCREFQGVSEQSQALKLDYYCSGFNAFSGKHSLGLGLYTLKKFFPLLKDLFYKALFEPEFSEEILEREKITLLRHLESLKDSPSSLAFKEFSSSIFKGSFYARDSVGEKKYIKECQTQDLQQFLKKHKEGSPLVYTIVGDLSLSEVEETVNQIESGLSLAKSSVYDSVPFELKQKAIIKEIPSDKAQTHIVMGYPGLRFSDQESLNVSLACALLGGQGGRLFINLRDKASLAYSVAPLEYSGYFAGYFGSYIACDPQKKSQAISMMRAELLRMAEEEVSGSDLEWMKNQILGRQAMGLQKNAKICDTILFDTLYGNPSFHYKTLRERVDAITAKDVKATMEKILSKPEFLVVAGN